MKYVYKKKIYILIFSILDILGNFIFFPFRIVRGKKIKHFNNILLIREDHMGDVISSGVVLRPLRKAYPAARIDFMTPSWGAGILKSDPNLNNIMEFDPPWFDRRVKGLVPWLNGFFDMVKIMKEGSYDLAIDLRGDARHIAAMFAAGIKRRISYGITGCGFLLTDQVPYEGTMHETEKNLALLKPLGIECHSPEVKLYFSSENILKARKIKEESDIDSPYAVVHIAPGHPAKAWSNEGFAEVVRYIHDKKGLTTILIGTAADSKVIKDVASKAGVNSVDLSGKTSLSVLGPILTGSSLFVGLDSGPSHIAAYAGAPTVMLFSGVNDPAQWAPRGDNVNIIYPGKGNDLSAVEAKEVFNAVDEVLGR